MDFLNQPIFWAFTFAMAAGLVCGYFLLRQAIVDAHFEIKHREEQERLDREKRRGMRP